MGITCISIMKNGVILMLVSPSSFGKEAECLNCISENLHCPKCKSSGGQVAVV